MLSDFEGRHVGCHLFLLSCLSRRRNITGEMETVHRSEAFHPDTWLVHDSFLAYSDTATNMSTPSLTLHVSHTKSGLISHSFLPKALKKKMMLSHRAVKKPQCAALFRLLSYFLLSALCVPCRARRMPSMDGRLSLLGSSLQGIHGSRGGLASPDSDSDG